MLITKKKERENERGERERDIVPLAPFRLISLGREQLGVRDGGSFQRQVKSIWRIESPLDQDLVAPSFLSRGSQGRQKQRRQQQRENLLAPNPRSCLTSDTAGWSTRRGSAAAPSDCSLLQDTQGCTGLSCWRDTVGSKGRPDHNDVPGGWTWQDGKIGKAQTLSMSGYQRGYLHRATVGENCLWTDRWDTEQGHGLGLVPLGFLLLLCISYLGDSSSWEELAGWTDPNIDGWCRTSQLLHVSTGFIYGAGCVLVRDAAVVPFPRL